MAPQQSLEARDAARQQAATNATWQHDYLDHSRPHVAHQTSSLWLPAQPIMHAARIVPAGQFTSPPSPPPGSPPVMYELRAYELTHGWGAVPTWVDAMADGLPSKLAAADARQAPVLVFAGYSDVGPMNCAMELWRHPSAAACMRCEGVGRGACAWIVVVSQCTGGVAFGNGMAPGSDRGGQGYAAFYRVLLAPRGVLAMAVTHMSVTQCVVVRWIRKEGGCVKKMCGFGCAVS